MKNKVTYWDSTVELKVKGFQLVCPRHNICSWIRDMDFDQGSGKETEKCTKNTNTEVNDVIHKGNKNQEMTMVRTHVVERTTDEQKEK